MNTRNVLAIFLKDAVDAMRDARIVVSLIVPIGLGLLYNNIFPAEGLATLKLGYHADDSPAILAGIRTQAGPFVDLQVREVADEAEARRLVANDTVDVALIVPPGTEAAIRAGQGPTILLIGTQPPGSGENLVTNVLERTTRSSRPGAPAIVPSSGRVYVSPTATHLGRAQGLVTVLRAGDAVVMRSR